MASSAPLLQKHGGNQQGGYGWWRRLIDVEEAQLQLSFAFPMILTSVAYYGIPLVSVMFAGHLGDVQLAGATLGNSWSTVSGIALMIGLSGALETLCGQAYGAGMHRMLGVYLQSSMIISAFFSVLISVLWYFSDSILIWLHQKPQVAKMAGLYLRNLIPGLFAFGSLQCLLSFLQTQTVVVPLVVCSALTLLIHVGLTFVVVHVLGLGFRGTTLSASVSLWISFLMLVFYVKYSKKFKLTWQGLSVDAFKHIAPTMKLAVPSAVMFCFEDWAFEILVLLAGLLPNSEMSTSLIAIVNTEEIAYMVTYGFSAAASTRVSNETGAGNIDKAKNAVAVTLKLAVFLGVAVVLLLVFGHDLWAKLFSDSGNIIRAFARMTLLLLTVPIVLDSAQGVLSGVARGCGWQHLAAWTNLVAFYVIGMPLAVLFSFKLGFHAQGLWMGIIVGHFIQSWTLLFITLRTNWKRLEISDGHGENRVLV